MTLLKKTFPVVLLFLVAFLSGCVTETTTTTTTLPTQSTTTSTTTATTATTATTTTTTTTTATTTTTTTTEGVTTRVYFYNSGSWAVVSAYIWGDSGEVLGTWPGTVTTADTDADWYYVDIPLDTSVYPVNLIFNDNGNGSQAGDTTINDLVNIYVTVIGGGKYESKVDALDAINPDVTTTVWFYNSDGWTVVSAYIWGGTGEILGGWPGTPCTQDGTTDWWYVVVGVDTSVSSVNFVFNNNGGGLQAGDTTVDDLINIYVTMAADTTFDSKEAAEASIPA